MTTIETLLSNNTMCVAYYKTQRDLGIMPSILTPIASLVLGFADSLIWEDARTITDEESYYDFMMEGWFYYLSQINCHKIIDSFIYLGQDPDNFLLSDVEKARINKQDNWGVAYMKLNHYTSFDLLGYWVRWPMPSNEIGFTYTRKSESLDTCLSLVIHLYEQLTKGTKIEPGSTFQTLEINISGVLGKSDKPWVK